MLHRRRGECLVLDSPPGHDRVWGMKSFENLNKTDVVFSKVEDLGATAWTLLEATS